MYGLNGGFTYIVNNSIDLDLGYRYMKTAKMTNIDKVDDINLALHYFY
jgi:opacity protein-like surface antigen